MSARPLEVGALMYDEGEHRLGQVTALTPTRVALRPVGGGDEWHTSRDKVREPTASEKLRPRIAAMNRAAGWGRRDERH